MKPTLLYFLITIFLFSCSSNDRPKNSDASNLVDIKTFDTTIYFSGSWLSENYFNSIREFKSPKEAQDGSEFIVIPDRTLKPTMIIANFHEGGPSLTIIKNGSKYQVWEMQDDSIVQLISDIQIISETKIKIADKNFIKINSLTPNDNFKVLEEVLFKGQYKNADGKNIEFKNNGELLGLDKFKYYSPQNDYFDAGSQVDQVGLGISEKNMEWFGFKFRLDTLEIYKLNCVTLDSTDNRCVVVENGDLIYKLWKKK